MAQQLYDPNINVFQPKKLLSEQENTLAKLAWQARENPILSSQAEMAGLPGRETLTKDVAAQFATPDYQQQVNKLFGGRVNAKGELQLGADLSQREDFFNQVKIGEAQKRQAAERINLYRNVEDRNVSVLDSQLNLEQGQENRANAIMQQNRQYGLQAQQLKNAEAAQRIANYNQQIYNEGMLKLREQEVANQKLALTSGGAGSSAVSTNPRDIATIAGLGGEEMAKILNNQAAGDKRSNTFAFIQNAVDSINKEVAEGKKTKEQAQVAITNMEATARNAMQFSSMVKGSSETDIQSRWGWLPGVDNASQKVIELAKKNGAVISPDQEKSFSDPNSQERQLLRVIDPESAKRLDDADSFFATNEDRNKSSLQYQQSVYASQLEENKGKLASAMITNLGNELPNAFPQTPLERTQLIVESGFSQSSTKKPELLKYMQEYIDTGKFSDPNNPDLISLQKSIGWDGKKAAFDQKIAIDRVGLLSNTVSNSTIAYSGLSVDEIEKKLSAFMTPDQAKKNAPLVSNAVTQYNPKQVTFTNKLNNDKVLRESLQLNDGMTLQQKKLMYDPGDGTIPVADMWRDMMIGKVSGYQNNTLYANPNNLIEFQARVGLKPEVINLLKSGKTLNELTPQEAALLDDAKLSLLSDESDYFSASTSAATRLFGDWDSFLKQYEEGQSKDGGVMSDIFLHQNN